MPTLATAFNPQSSPMHTPYMAPQPIPPRHHAPQPKSLNRVPNARVLPPPSLSPTQLIFAYFPLP